jgi:ferrous iron transport protein A
LFSETGALDPHNPVQIFGLEAAHFILPRHSAILYFVPFGGVLEPLALKKRKKKVRPLDKDFGVPHTGIKMQLSGNNVATEPFNASLIDLRRGDAAILDRIDLPTDDARRLMELGFLPGAQVTAGFSAPGGDPRVFQVDGSEIALRRETARRMKVRLTKKNPRG